MGELVKVKVRRIGDSLGVLIPKKLIDENKIKEGEEIEISVLKQRKRLIKEALGMFKDGPYVSFEREKDG
jgi:antitoxin component of MazEF toxin-antitoxin module